MKATQRLHDLGQSLWLDNITRGLLTKGTLRHYITELPVTGLTSNPTIYDHANKNTEFYNEAIRQKVREGKSGEALFFCRVLGLGMVSEKRTASALQSPGILGR
jgi:transaldolase